jgi:hypothetical protein
VGQSVNGSELATTDIVVPELIVGVHVELHQVAVRVGDVEALAHSMVERHVHRHPSVSRSRFTVANSCKEFPTFNAKWSRPSPRDKPVQSLDECDVMVRVAR